MYRLQSLLSNIAPALRRLNAENVAKTLNDFAYLGAAQPEKSYCKVLLKLHLQQTQVPDALAAKLKISSNQGIGAYNTFLMRNIFKTVPSTFTTNG